MARISRIYPRSKFLEVQCKKCKNKQIIFSHASREVRCLVCNEVLALPKGGKAEIKCEILKVLENSL